MASPRQQTATLDRRQVLAGAAGLAATMPTGSGSRARAAPIALRRGMNLWPWFSLTREKPAPSRDYDWPPFQESRAVPRRGDLERLRDLGIDFVRIPVDPGPFIAADGKRRNLLVAEVAGAVSLCRKSGLNVIVNLHPNMATHYWTPERMAGGVSAPEAGRFIDLVVELARVVASIDSGHVALEPVNEPPGTCAARAWPEMQASIVRRVRAAATELPIVVTGGCGSLLPGLEALDPAGVGDDNVIYTFHFYEPYVFSHQGAPWMTGEPMYRYLNGVPWPSAAGAYAKTMAAVDKRMMADLLTPEAEKRAIRKTIEGVLGVYFDARPDRGYIRRHLDRAAAWSDRHGIARGRLLLGEFGALRSDARYVAANPADRERYIRDVRETAEELGFPWAMWNFFDGMGLVTDDRSRRFDPAIASALGLGG